VTWSKRWHTFFAALAFGIPLYGYIRTLTVSVPFWDSGEFIATSVILGLPHPPGSPVYTMIGRLVSLLPFGAAAWRINFMSAFFSSVTCLLTFLIVSRALRRWWGDEPSKPANLFACGVGALVAALFVAFSNSFWDNAIEAEVYAFSVFLIMLCVWLAFRWWDHLGENGNDRLLVLIAYVLAISTGVHLNTILVGPGLLVLLALIRPNYFTRGRFWISALVLGGFVFFVWLNDVSETINVPGGIVLILFATICMVWIANRKKLVKNNVVTWWALATLVGFTIQLFLLIRSQQHPAINEGSPDTFTTWKDYLLRKQYGPTNPFERRADVGYQITHMYLRYVGQQYRLTDGFGPFGPGSFWVIAVNAIPYLLLALGAWWNWKRDKKTFWFFAAQNFVMGPALIFYLNFTDHEVRERDYFFTNNYMFLAIWMGMGAAGILDWLSRAFQPAPAANVAAAPSGGERYGVWLGAAALVGISLLPAKEGWFEHDRSGFYIAHDYAYNMLTPLEPNAIVMTNGDNDTFPLWYIQEVEHVRKDVRVVNLSLLNTAWYIKQLGHLEPKVPFSYSDAQMDALQPYQDEKTGKVIWVKDQAVADLVKTNQWKHPIYLAVTVPEQLGFEKNLTLEGLVFRVSPHDVGERAVDTRKTMHNLYSVFHYGGLLDRNRDYDRSVYKDDNAYKLVQNYSAAHVQVAYQLQQAGQAQDAIKVLHDAVKMTPDFPGLLEYLGKSYQDMGDTASAERVFLDAQKRFPTSAEFYFHLGVIHWQKGHRLRRMDLVEQGLAELRRACELDQRYFDWYGGLFSALWLEGRKPEAVDVLRAWSRAHPEDAQGQTWLQTYEDSLRILQGGAPAPGGARTHAARGSR
jgi:tetratricopeptide (TPR) repeat protein